jgi:hypothetical protein
MDERENDPIMAALDVAEKTSAAPAIVISKPADLIPYCKMMDPQTLSVEPMQSWPHVLGLLAFWSANKRTATLKSRQMCGSSTMALYALHHAGWNAYTTTLVLNYNQEEASKFIWKMKVMWLSLPKSIRPQAEWATTHARFSNGSRVQALPVTDNAGAGETPTLVVIDEAALIGGLENVWPAISQGAEYGQIHLFSTPRGSSIFFANLIEQSRAGRGPFKFKLLNYREHPDKNPATEKGRAWVAARKAELSPRDFAREHECEFVRPGASFFDDDTVKRVQDGCAPPQQTELRGRLSIWNARPKGRVVIGADVAEGLDDGDFSAAVALDCETGDVVATYRAHVGVTDYAEDLVALAKMYNSAWLSIEANNHGHAVCMWVYRQLKYKKLFRETREGEGQLASTSTTRLGTLTTASSKPAMLSAVERQLRTGGITLRDRALAGEIASYLCLPGGGYGGAPGTHDDMLMALLLAEHGRSRRVPRCW